MVGECGLLVGLSVARIALRGETLELAGGCAFVARVTVQRGVSSDQRKPVLVVLNGLDGNVPAFHVVALFTLCAHLPPMDVGVAVGALCPNVRENQLGVAGRTSNFFVEAPEREAGLVVIKFRNRAHRFPPDRRVAVLARHVEVAVGTAGLSVSLIMRGLGRACWRQQRQEENAQKCRQQGGLLQQLRHRVLKLEVKNKN